MILEKIKQLGLSDKEAKVYLTALELGGESVQNIAKKSGVHRATTYQCLEKLEEIGLIVTEIRGKKKKYAGEYPEKLLTNIIDKQNEFKKREVEIVNLLPELKAIFNFSKDKPRIKFFEGLDGLKELYQDTLYNNQEVLAFISVSSPDKNLRNWLEKEYVKNRIRKNIFAKVVAPADREVLNYKNKDSQELRETKLVDVNKYHFSIEIDIYGGNKVAFISYSKEEMFGVIIESREVYNTMKFIFQLVWDNIK